MAKISVIIPTFNRAHVLKRSINSVLNQSFKDFELIIVDDGSTDETLEIVNSYKDARVQYFYQENKGVSSARNLGIEKSKGEWVALLDSDDEWLPHRLKAQLDFLKEKPNVKLIHGEEIWIRNGKRVNPKKKHQKSGGDIYINCLKLCLISPSASLIHKSLFSEVGLFDEEFIVCEDYDLWLRVTSKYPIGFVEDPIIVKYGGHEDQLSAKYVAMDWFRVQSMLKILDNFMLSDEKRSKTVSEIEHKCNILLKGYIKHGNIPMKSKVESILNQLNS